MRWINEDDYRAIIEALTEKAHDDYVGLWEIPWWVERLAPDLEAEEVKAVSLTLLQDVLDQRLLRAGELTDLGRGFSEWQRSPKEVVAQVEVEWTRLGRPPNIGEVLWLDSINGGDGTSQSVG